MAGIPVPSGINLPEGFSLKEDGHCVYLVYNDETVAIFNSSATNPEEIKKEAESYLLSLS